MTAHTIRRRSGQISLSREVSPKPRRHAALAAADATEPLLNRFIPRFRPTLRELAQRSRRHADLLETAAAVCVAIAGRRGPPELRGEAVFQVGAGAPLSVVEAELGVPSWLRRIRPEAFTAPLPEILAPAEDGAGFRRRIVNEIPADLRELKPWLRRVFAALAAADGGFAIWIAKRRGREARLLNDDLLDLLAAHCWFSAHPDYEAGRLIERPFRHDAGLAAAVEDAAVWLRRLLFGATTRGREEIMAWTAPRQLRGFEFTPLHDTAGFLREARLMSNCLGRYAQYLRPVLGAFWSIRRNGAPVADLELRPNCAPPYRARHIRLLGPRNAEPSPEVRDAVKFWLEEAQPAFPFGRERGFDIDRRRWDHLMAPYWRERRPRGAFQPQADPNTHPALIRAATRIGGGL